MKWAVRITLLILCITGTARFCKKQTGGFTVLRITSSLPFHPEWEVGHDLGREQLQALFAQPYSFLSKGAQTFAFASADGKYVVKFFKHDHLKKNGKLIKDFTSYIIAYKLLKQETGLLYLHLNTTAQMGLSLDLIDRLGIHHHIPLDNYTFLVQKRASGSYETVRRWVEAGQIEEAKRAISSLVRVLKTRSERGIYDKDPDINTNFGFVEEEAVQIDVGRFRLRKEPLDRGELLRITDNFHQYLMTVCPQLDAHLQEELKW